VESTSITLLQRLRLSGQESAWQRFVDLYRPLLFAWSSRAGLAPEDAADHVQEVFAHLVRKLPEFQYDRRKGAFRCWLRTVFVNKLRERQRRKQRIAGQARDEELADLVDGADPFTEQEYHQYLARRALELMQAEFETATWQACWESVVNDLPASQVAQKLGITENAVYIARHRVLRRLRQELAELLE
jgi:RNA polymerase sigma-70 factor (ECF subfamily)